jgi:hypothetical protein
MGCDPIEGLARIAIDPEKDLVLKARCLTELAPFVYPKRKAIEVAADKADGMKVNVEFIGPRVDFGDLPMPKQLPDRSSSRTSRT